MSNIKLYTSITAVNPPLYLKASTAILHLDNNGVQQDFIPTFIELFGSTEVQISKILNQVIMVAAKAETTDNESFEKRLKELHEIFPCKI
jgi:hypothetical protein